MSTETIIRARVSYQKLGSLRYIGHIDLHSLFERALRRSQLPLRFSQGFKPKARLNLAAALPLGMEGLDERLDFWLNETVDQDLLLGRLAAALPAELPVKSLSFVDKSLPSLQADLRSALYEVLLPQACAAQAREAMEAALNAEFILVQRKEKMVNMRPWIQNFSWEAPNCLHVLFTAVPQASGRPDELLRFLGINPALAAMTRLRLFFETEENDG